MSGFSSHPTRAYDGIRSTPLSLLLLLLFVTPSCSTTSGKTRCTATVPIYGHTQETIRQTVREVFTKAGYYDASHGHLWAYDRKASTGGQVMYGSWFADEKLVERAKLNLVPLGGDPRNWRLDCEATMVRDADSSFEEEVRMTRLKSGPYEELLREVVTQLP